MDLVSGVLTLPLKGQYFDEILAGTKTEEFRQVSPFWRKRIEFTEFDAIVLTRGYPKGGGIDGETRLVRQWRGYKLRTITHPHFGPDPVDVFAIDVSVPMQSICYHCRARLDPSRLWAGTCGDCMAKGCPKSPEDAEAGDPCDACDCVPPTLRRWP